MDIDAYYITPDEAIEQQKSLRGKISLNPLDREVTTVAGADISFDRGSDVLHAGFVVLRLPDLKPVARSLATKRVNFPYIPGLLAFREIPALLEAWGQLEQKPDLTVIDGHGIAHPRRVGVAAHFGVTVDHPTIGCAKNILTGDFRVPAQQKGAYTWIEEGADKIGIVYRSRSNVQPVYISPGHKVSFEDTLSVIKQCLTKYKLPETTRQAHRAVNKLRKGELKPGCRENSDPSLF